MTKLHKITQLFIKIILSILCVCMCWSALVSATNRKTKHQMFLGKYRSHIKCFHIAGELSVSELSR